MTYTRLCILLLSLALWGWVASCGPKSGTDGDVPPDPTTTVGTPYVWKTPANFPEPVYNLQTNPLTKEGVALGRTLFYDAALSKDGTVTCAFCHSPSTAFSHTDHPLSHGIKGQVGTRNVPGIFNMAWRETFFWDGSVTSLDLLPVSPIQNPVEMGDSLQNVLQKVRTSGRYRPLFKAAYGTDSITSDRFLKALSQFMLTMVSANSAAIKSRFSLIRASGITGCLNSLPLRSMIWGVERLQNRQQITTNFAFPASAILNLLCPTCTMGGLVHSSRCYAITLRVCRTVHNSTPC